MKKSPFNWDKNSDQPYSIKNKEYKNMMRKKNMYTYIPMFFSSIIIFPISLLVSYFFKGKQNNSKDFFGMGVNLDKGEEQVELIKELNCKNLLIRVPLEDIASIDKYVSFTKLFPKCKIVINILQNRENIENKELLRKNLTLIFSSFKGICNEFQIANAINRTKWGFFSVKEYLDFYLIAFNIRNESFKNYVLIGPSVIDFEYHFTIRALFNKLGIYFDKVSALLYVDRKGAPENKQLFTFDTNKKINLLYTLASLAKQSSNKIIISEVNWPISNTKPYAPTSEKECVSEEEYARFMLRYYLLAYGSLKIQSVYWHQLIAAGYGLIDNRKSLRQRSAFEVYKVMLSFLQDSELIKYSQSKDLHVLTCKINKNKKLDIIWLSSKRKIPLNDFGEVYDMFGKQLKNDIKISDHPIYAYHQ